MNDQHQRAIDRARKTHHTARLIGLTPPEFSVCFEDSEDQDGKLRVHKVILENDAWSCVDSETTKRCEWSIYGDEYCRHAGAALLRLEDMKLSSNPHTIEGLRLILGGTDRVGLTEVAVMFDAPLPVSMDDAVMIKPTSGKSVTTFRGIEI